MKHLRELRCRWVRVLKLAASGEKNRFRLFNLFLELSNFAALSIVLRRFAPELIVAHKANGEIFLKNISIFPMKSVHLTL